jgi:hypothetical protein
LSTGVYRFDDLDVLKSLIRRCKWKGQHETPTHRDDPALADSNRESACTQ